jgi:hypothetical protein
MIKNSQRKKEKRAAAKWLLSLIGEDWGERVQPRGADSPRPIHVNTNKRFEAVISQNSRKKTVVPSGRFAELLDALSWQPVGEEEERTSGIWLERLSQRLIIDHFDGVPREFRINGEIIIKPETVYFTGRRTKRGETCLTLLMVDIDAHKVGGPKEAMEFAGYLRNNFFPSCYIEVSTNGNGAHIFFIIDKTDWADVDYNAMLRSFDAWLKGILAETGIPLDCVEIKGNCATVSWKDGIPKHRMGTLAKLPREWERFGELRASPIYTAHQLLALTTANPVKEKEAPRVQKMRQSGSVPCRGIDPERIEGWISLAKWLLPTDVHVGQSAWNRLVVTAEDVGVFCALLEFVGKHMNEDGTVPWKRTKGLWDCLCERGVIRRSFNAKRFAWIRRMLNGAGLVDIQDPTYVIGERAAKWSPSEKFWELASSINKEEEREQYFTETAFVIDPQEAWKKGIPLMLVGIQAMEMAERRRMEELVEAIICPAGWILAA